MTTPSLIGPLLAFVAILALIPLALWLLRRSPLGARFGAGLGAAAAGGAAAPVRLVGMLSLAPQQRIVTVEVGSGEARQWLVLGVSPAGIASLHQMPAQAELPRAAATSPFAQLLLRHARGLRQPAPVDAVPPGATDGR